MYFSPAQRSRLVYDCLLRTPFDVTSENESEEQRGQKTLHHREFNNHLMNGFFIFALVLQGTGDARERRVLELEKIFTGASTSAGNNNQRRINQACS